uniref:Kunitz domain n=1 Tax=Argas monolakensis TaxID=34602 RepID=Q09JU7_ARGMO|nr:Kunitz domain [Argas monolakensis]
MLKLIFVAITAMVLLDCGRGTDLFCRYPHNCQDSVSLSSCKGGRVETYHYNRISRACIRNPLHKCGSTCNNFNSEKQCRTSCKSYFG